jgi:hypothetical protein
MSVSRRVTMYAAIGAQLLVLASIVAPQELNMALDTGAAVDLDLVRARAARDSFRGAYVSGESALDLDGPSVVLPAAGFRPGERVTVLFTAQPERRPRIAGVERGRRAAPFTPTRFSVPGRVVDPRAAARGAGRDRRLVARVGWPPVSIALDLPDSIAVDDSALDRFTGPGLVRARLHAGFLGRRYFTDVRLLGRAWSDDTRFAWDDAGERLLVLAPRQPAGRRPDWDAAVRSDLFVFDGAGKELAASEIAGRVIDAVVEADGHVLAVVSERRWGDAEASLVRLDGDGRVLQRSAPVSFDRILGFDVTTGGVWVALGAGASQRQAPYHVQRATLGGLREPRLGPFDSAPRAVVSAGADVWVVETDRHRVKRFDGATGRVVREYRDLNSPVDVVVDGEAIVVIEANRSQLTRLAADGTVAWRVPRFQGLTWAVLEPGGGGGWVGASTYEGAPAGVLRFGPDGTVTRTTETVRPVQDGDWRRGIGRSAFRSTRDGRLLFREREAIAILSADGATLTRVLGFRFPTAQRLRG